MSGEDKIPFLVDGPQEVAKGAFDSTAFTERLPKIVELKTEQLNTAIGSVIGKMQGALKEASDKEGEFELSKVTFSLAVDAKGGVSILSLAKAQVGATAGIEVTLERRKQGA